MKIRTYLLVFALAILLPMIAFSAIAVVAFDRQQRAVVERGGIETARAMVNAVDRELGSSVTTLQTLATARSLERGDLAMFQEDSRRVLARQRDWITISLFAPTGRRVMDLATPPGAALTDLVESESFETVRRTDRPAIGAITAGPRGRRAFAVRVRCCARAPSSPCSPASSSRARSPRSSQRSRSPPTGSAPSSTRRARSWRGRRGAERAHRAVGLARVRPPAQHHPGRVGHHPHAGGRAGLHGLQPIVGDRLGRGNRDSTRDHRRAPAALALGGGRRRRGVPGGRGGAVAARGPAHRASDRRRCHPPSTHSVRG